MYISVRLLFQVFLRIISNGISFVVFKEWSVGLGTSSMLGWWYPCREGQTDCIEVLIINIIK